MPSRRRARQRALQILFLWDARRQPVDQVISAYYDTLYSEEHPERDPFVATNSVCTTDPGSKVLLPTDQASSSCRITRPSTSSTTCVLAGTLSRSARCSVST
jgi:transcription termination factor NusB